MASRNPKRALVEREEEDHGFYHHKLHPVPTRPHNNAQPNPCASPKSSHQFIFPYNGSSSSLHAGTNIQHPLDALRRLHHPLPPASPTSSSSPSFPGAQRSPRTPTSQNVGQGHKTPKTPETPVSPQLRPLSSPPPSSPVTLGGGGRGAQTQGHHPQSVIVGGSPLSLSPSLSPSVHNMNCVSPHQRSRHPSASPSPLSEPGGGSIAAAEALTGSKSQLRRKSSSSSPQSPLPGGSPNPSPHLPKYKLEDILEHFKNSGNNSTNHHHLLIPTPPSLSTNQSSSSPHALSLKLSKNTTSPTSCTAPPGFGLSSAGPSSVPLGPFLNHQSKMPHPASFPASSLLSAAAKAQLANQVTQGQSSHVVSSQVGLPSSLEVLTEAQQKQLTKVTNSTLLNSHLPSAIASARPHHPSLAAASSVLLPSSHSLAQSLSPSLPSPAERSALHRKRQRRSPTALCTIKDPQQAANGPLKTPTRDAASTTVINLSSLAPPLSPRTPTSEVQNQNAVMVENHMQAGQTPRLPPPKQTAHLSRPLRQGEALDITTGMVPAPFSLDPPTQPLSALLHLLSVQNAQASASSCAPPQPIPLSVEGAGHVSKLNPRHSPSSPAPHSKVHNPPLTVSPCRSSNTNPLPLALQPSSPPPALSQFRSMQTQSQCDKSSPHQRRSPADTVLPSSNVASLHNSGSSSRCMSPTPLIKYQPADDHIPTIDSQVSVQDGSPQSTVPAEIGSGSVCTSVDLSHSPGSVSVALATSPKPLDLSNHVLALLTASSTTPQEDSYSSDQTAGEHHIAGTNIQSYLSYIIVKVTLTQTLQWWQLHIRSV